MNERMMMARMVAMLSGHAADIVGAADTLRSDELLTKDEADLLDEAAQILIETGAKLTERQRAKYRPEK